MPATVTWVNPTGGDWDNPANWSDGSTNRLPGPADDAVVAVAGITVTHSFPFANDSVGSLTSAARLALSGGTLSLGAASEVDALALSGGTLGGAGDLTVDHAFTWSGGTMQGPSTAQTVVNGSAEISGGGFNGPTLSGRGLDNNGTAVVDDGTTLTFANSATLSNEPTATLTLQGNNSLGGGFGPPSGQVSNAGLLVKKGPDNSASAVALPLDNGGTVDVQSGTLAVNGTLSNEGSFRLEPGAVAVVGGFGGSSSGDISLGASSFLDLGGSLTLQGGATVEAAAGSRLQLDGTVTQQYGSSVSLAAGSALVVGPLSFDVYNLQGGSVSGPGVVQFPSFSSQMTVSGSASIDNLSMTGGTITLQPAGSLAVQNLTQTGGTVTGAGGLTVTDSLLWTGGLWSGAGTRELDGSTEIGRGTFGGPSLNGGALNNFGTAVVDDATTFTFGGGAAFNNEFGAELDLLGTGSLATAFLQSGQLNNAGLLVKAGPDNGVSTVGLSFANTGTIDVQTGTLSAAKGLSNDGAFDLEANAVASVNGGSSGGDVNLGAGSRLDLGGTFTLQDGSTAEVGPGARLTASGTVTQQAGAAVSLAAGALLDVAPGFTGGSYTLAAGGAVSGPGVVNVGGPLSVLTAGSGTAIDTLALGGGGRVSVTAPGGLTVQNMTQTGGLLAGAGTLTIGQSLLWTGGTMTDTAHTVLDGSAEIGGSFPSSPTLNDRLFDNFGTVTVDDGSTLSFNAGATFTNAAGAELDLPGNSSLALGSGPPGQVVNAGLILKTGAGSQSNIGLPFTNSGTVEIVLGTLAVNGTYTQTSSGALTVHLAGLTAGAQYGRLQVNGKAVLDGALNVLLDNGFSPAAGDAFRVLTFTSRSGDFASENFPDLGDGLSWSAVYDSSGLNFKVQSS